MVARGEKLGKYKKGSYTLRQLIDSKGLLMAIHERVNVMDSVTDLLLYHHQLHDVAWRR